MEAAGRGLAGRQAEEEEEDTEAIHSWPTNAC